MNTCFIIGHSDTSESVYPSLEYHLNKLITDSNITEFIVGHYGNFDRMAARAVRSIKACHPEVILTLLLPYLTGYPLPKGFDGSVYPDGLENVPRRFAILRANCLTIDRCDCVIACVHRTYGGAYQCLEYARRRRKRIINLAGSCPGG